MKTNEPIFPLWDDLKQTTVNEVVIGLVGGGLGFFLVWVLLYLVGGKWE